MFTTYDGLTKGFCRPRPAGASIAAAAEPRRLTHRGRVAIVAILASLAIGASAESGTTPRYLLFQLFTAAGTPDQALGGTMSLQDIPDRAALMRFARAIKDRIGTTGDKRRKLGITPGPLALDHSDEQVRRLIRDSFAVARELDMAVALHLDDSMFWARHPGLRVAKGHLERLDWEGPENTGRRLDWGPEPTKVAPQLCFNSPPVVAAVRERAALIGRETAREYQRLQGEGRGHLFAGVVVGWETMISRDFDSDRAMGYCALVNYGYSASEPPKDMNAARAKVVQEFMELWAQSIHEQGVPTRLIYNHIAFTAQGLGGNPMDHPPAATAFSRHYRPGLSTYPSPGTLAEIRALLLKHGSPSWASVEGTNVIPSGQPGEKTMETYLGRMFNHGAVMVNIFAWGVGPDDFKRNFFRRATEGPEAIAGYRRFLSGQRLREDPEEPFSLAEFQKKIHDIQSRLPQWVQRTRRQSEATAIMRELENSIKRGDITAADIAADKALELLGQNQ